MTLPGIRTVLLCTLPLLIVGKPEVSHTNTQLKRPGPDLSASQRDFKEEPVVKVHYLEIVTPDVDATCDALEKLRGVEFGEPIPELGHARTARLDGGGRLGVRAPMRDTDEPVVRPYLLVDDVEAAVQAARAAGGEIAMPPTEIPGRGTFAIYILGGIQHGLWQL